MIQGIDRASWLVTGAAGFIGSHLVERLLKCGAMVRGLDNFSSGKSENLSDVRRAVGEGAWSNFDLRQADVRDADACELACRGIDYVLHHAAIGSVPASIENPKLSHDVNIGGFVNILDGALKSRCRRVIYASSSAVYGDDDAEEKREARIGNPLSPYAVTKHANEIYASVYERVYGLSSLGLRYFNIYGTRQDPAGPYSAVIPTWANAIASGRTVRVNGDGSTTRDFCYVGDVVDANIVAAMHQGQLGHQVFNVGTGESTSLRDLVGAIRASFVRAGLSSNSAIDFRPFRQGDVLHSRADVDRIARILDFHAKVSLPMGLDQTVAYFAGRSASP